MEEYRCFMPDCMQNVEYACPCSYPPVYICKLHTFNHLKVPNNDHVLKPIFVDNYEGTREVILLEKCDSAEDFNSKFKEEGKIQRNFKNISVEEDLEEKSEILESSKCSELERQIKGTCLACENDYNASKASVTLAYQEFVSNYQQKSSLFIIVLEGEITKLLIYDTEIESQASIILDTPQPLTSYTRITQLPNGKLFCYGNNNPLTGITVLIDENYRVQELPSGTPCGFSSAIYFKNNVYCFGGMYNKNPLTLSSRFDLDRNQWNELTPLPNPDGCCNSIIFNGSILISGWCNKNLWRYSIDSNSFSTIPHDFAKERRKILIYAERLYVIEFYGFIYESEIGSDTAWRQITTNSTIDYKFSQTYCQYNKEEIYIGCVDYYRNEFFCWKFNLNEKRLIKLVYK